MAEVTVATIARLELDPERKDILVMQGVPPEEMSRANALMQTLVPPGVRILFLPDEVKLSVLSGGDPEGHKALDEWEAASRRFVNGV